MEPLPRARSTPCAQVDVADLRSTASEARSPQAYMSSSSARSRSAARLGRRAGSASRRATSSRREHLRQLLALARRAQLGGRVVGDDLLAAQVAVERAQAGGLALDRRRARPAGAAAAAGARARTGTRRARCGRPSTRRAPRRCEEVRRTAAGRSGRPRACCATGRARTRGRRGSRARGARTARGVRRWRATAMSTLVGSPARRGAPCAVRAAVPRAVSASAAARAASCRPMSVLASVGRGDRVVEVGQRPARRSRSARSRSVSTCAVGRPVAREQVDALVGEARGSGSSVTIGSHVSAPRPISSASSRWAVCQRRLALDVELAGRDLERVGSPSASRGWRTSQTCSSS